MVWLSHAISLTSLPSADLPTSLSLGIDIYNPACSSAFRVSQSLHWNSAKTDATCASTTSWLPTESSRKYHELRIEETAAKNTRIKDAVIEISSNQCRKRRRPIYVHESLVENNTRFQQFETNENGILALSLDASLKAIVLLGDWFYRDLVITELRFDSEQLEQQELVGILEAHALGRKLGCFDFMDTLLDVIIQTLAAGSTFCPHVFIKAFAREFPRKSGGWNFATDFLMNSINPECDMGNCVTKCGLDDIDDSALLLELARRISATEGHELPRDDLPPYFIGNFVYGYLYSQKHQDRAATSEDRSWAKTDCRYHSHKELALPCYKSID